MKDGKLTLPLESEKDNNSISDNEYSVFDADGYWLCDVRDEDHAKTVVRAVNSHDALVEACEAAQVWFAGGPGLDVDVMALLQSALAKAKEA